MVGSVQATGSNSSKTCGSTLPHASSEVSFAVQHAAAGISDFGSEWPRRNLPGSLAFNGFRQAWGPVPS